MLTELDARPADGKYHREAGAGLPKSSLQSVCRDYVLRHTFHARQAAQNDRYGAIDLPGMLRVSLDNVVECDIENGAVKKMLVRVPYHRPGFDLCLVLVDPVNGSAFVKTTWLNRHTDTHRTLLRSAYVSR